MGKLINYTHNHLFPFIAMQVWLAFFMVSVLIKSNVLGAYAHKTNHKNISVLYTIPFIKLSVYNFVFYYHCLFDFWSFSICFNLVLVFKLNWTLKFELNSYTILKSFFLYKRIIVVIRYVQLLINIIDLCSFTLTQCQVDFMIVNALIGHVFNELRQRVVKSIMSADQKRLQFK